MAISSKSLLPENLSSSQYVGRFAPSPSGPLHFGSLVTAVGSYLQAKKNDGKWLLRIEDIDPQREVPGAADSIIECLTAHHLFWDGQLVYQSRRSGLYLEKLEYLSKQGYTYFCECTRAQIMQLDKQELCPCIDNKLNGQQCAVRFKHLSPLAYFNDELLGRINFNQYKLPAQFSLKRKDGLFAYQLAVVVDDIEQGVTEVARGADLLSATAFQLSLYQAFQHSVPKFLHFPVVVAESGQKLSKQNRAKGLDNSQASMNLIQALTFLGLHVPTHLQKESCSNILYWAVAEWEIHKLVVSAERIDNRIGHVDSI